MERLDLRNAVFVMDLDDTLYKEDDYEASGINSVCELVLDLYGKEIDAALLERTDSGGRDLMAAVCDFVGVPQSVKGELVWAYRLHRPAIRLDEMTGEVVRRLSSVCAEFVILTDGRSVTQRLKLKALGLSGYPAYISEECGIEKPNPARFVQVMKDHPAELYVYVGDNPTKDFIAPNSLGWKTFGLRGDSRNIHAQSCSGLPVEYQPQTWINNLGELLNYIC